MSKHVDIRWILCSFWMAFVLLTFVSGAAADDYCEDKTLRESELAMEIGASCSSEEAKKAKEEQCNEAAENLIDECRDYCADQKVELPNGFTTTCAYSMVLDKPEVNCREFWFFGPHAIIECKRTVTCSCQAENTD